MCLERPDAQCKIRPCVRLCCPSDHYYDLQEDACIHKNELPQSSTIKLWRPQLLNGRGEPSATPNHDVKFFYGPPTGCGHAHKLDSREVDFSVYETGELVIGALRLGTP